MKHKHIITFAFLLIAVSSCKTLDTNLSVPKRDVPTAFQNSKDTVNIADINWRNYFADSLLLKLIDTALISNIDLQIALQRIEISRSGVRFATGELFPTISAAGLAGTDKYAKYTPDFAGNSTTEYEPGKIVPNPLNDFYLGLQSSWEIDIWGKLRNKKKAAFARYLGSVEGRNLAITNLISEISSAYYELLALDNQLEIIRETIKLQQDALDIVTIQKQAAAANELAVKQFEAQLLNSKGLEIEVLQRIMETENKINFLLGRFPQSVIRDKSVFTKSIPMQAKVGIPSDLLKNRPDIRQAEFDLIASKANVKAARAAFYPSLSITGGMGFQAFNTAYLFASPQSVAYSLIGNLAAPLINRSTIEAEFRSAKANQIEAMYNYQKSIINGYVEVYNEMVNIKNLEQIYDFKNKEVNVLTQSIETSSELFKTGRANYLEVLLTQQNALQAKLELINVKQQQYNSATNIYKALGGGWR